LKSCLVLREFKEIDPKNEFRGFVKDKQLLAACQYFDDCYFEEVKEHKMEIEKRLKHFYDSEIKNKIPWNDCVIDFVVLKLDKPFDPQGKEKNIKIVEINPPDEHTGTLLFSWKGIDRLQQKYKESNKAELKLKIIENLEARKNFKQSFASWKGEISKSEKRFKKKNRNK